MSLRPDRGTAVISAVTGLLVLAGGMVLLRGRMMFLVNAREYDATVVDVVWENHYRGSVPGYRYYPVVEVPDDHGGLVRIKSTAGSEESAYRVGDRARVLCSLASPRECNETSLGHVWVPPLIVLLVAFVFFLPMLLRRLLKERDKADAADAGAP